MSVAMTDYAGAAKDARELMRSPALDIEAINLALTVEPVDAWDHYLAHRDDYELIQNRLDQVREQFLSVPADMQIEMAQKSYTFAAISVQTPLPVHEAAYYRLWNGDPLENVREALRSVNYNRSKEAAITEMLQAGDLWSEFVGLLASGGVDDAHRFLLRNVKYVSTAKAPFTLSMLGFTEKMCVDANMLTALGIEGRINTKSVERYDALCDWILSKFQSLSAELPPFLVQWVVFDTVRDEVAHHDVWFESVGIKD